jgi:hypothetical protein
MRRITVALAVALAVLVVGVAVLAANGYEIRRFVLGGGGGRLQAGPYVLEGTAGQAVAGEASNATHQLCSGFWCEDMVYHQSKVYLPLVLRSH